MGALFYFCIAITIFSGMGLLGSIMLTRTSRAVSERVIQVTVGVTTAAVRSKPEKSKKAELQKNIIAGVRWIRSKLAMTEDPRLIQKFTQAGFKTSAARDTY